MALACAGQAATKKAFGQVHSKSMSMHTEHCQSFNQSFRIVLAQEIVVAFDLYK
jgi:hypothetical protein